MNVDIAINKINWILDKNNYKQYKDILSSCDIAYQKRITSDHWTKYFINIKLFIINEPNKTLLKIEADSHFHDSHDNYINITRFNSDDFYWIDEKLIQSKINKIENFFEDIFIKMKFSYYERNLKKIYSIKYI
jgi:hypothetical protein